MGFAQIPSPDESPRIPPITPDDFKEIPVPKKGTEELYKLRNSPNEFAISLTEKGIAISKKSPPAAMCSLSITNVGTFIGKDRGEWGGLLTFMPSGTLQQDTIAGGNIKSIFVYQNEIYYLEGLAHLSYNGGGIYKLTKSGDTYKSSLVFDLKNEPLAYANINDTLYIACLDMFYIMHDFKVMKQFKNADWNELYTTSVTVKDYKNIYLGLHGGYGLLNAKNGTFRLFTYTK